MFDRKYHTRTIAGLLSLAALAISLTSYFDFGVHSAGRPDDVEFLTNTLNGTDVISRPPLVVNDVIYNSQDQKLYVTRSSSIGPDGNSIAAVDPISGQVLSSAYVGSEPGKLTLSDDGHTIYTALDGAFAIRRFDTVTQTAGVQFPIGSDGSNTIYTASDIAVVPGNPNRVAVARYMNSVSPPGAGVAIFDNGVKLPLAGPGHSSGANYLAFASSTTLYGGGLYDGLRTMTVSDSGVTDTGTRSTFGVGRLKYDAGLIYTQAGQVIDPQARTLIGTFYNTNTPAFVPDSGVGRAFYAVRDSSSGSVILKAFDINTFVLIGTLSIPNVTSDPMTLVRYGSNGLAMRTYDGKLFLIQTTLVPTTDPLPTPSATPTVTPTPTPSPYTTFSRQLSLETKDLIYSDTAKKLLVSVPSSAGSRGNSVTEIDPATGEIGDPVFVGSEPGRLALTDDQLTLYVGLTGAGAIRKYDVAAKTAGTQFSLGFGGNGFRSAGDIDVMPGSPDTVGVSFSNSYDGAAVYDNGVLRGTAYASGPLEFNSETEVLIGTNPVYRYAVSKSGLSLLGNILTASYYGDVKLDNGLLFMSGGRVIDTATRTIRGTFGGLGSYSALVVDSAKNRVYFLTTGTSSSLGSIRAYTLDTFLFVGSIPVPDSFSSNPLGFVRWGSNGFAYRTENGKVTIIQSTLVDPADPVPTPTPTVTPTPTPSPVNVPTFMRQVNLPVNDVVYSDATGSLYVSVPSVAGAGSGNTISRIDPVSGEVGTSTFIGSEPSKLALSGDGKTLYAKLDGSSNAIRRLDVTTGTAGPQFTPDSSFQLVEDIEVMPGRPNTVALGVRYNGVAIYDDGVRRPATSTGGLYSVNSMEFANESTIYGYDGETTAFELGKFTVTDTGVTGVSVGRGLFGGFGTQMKYAGGLLYSTSGRVVDPEAKTLKGTFASNGTAMAVDSLTGRVFFLNNNVLTAYDANTFTKIGSATLPTFSGTPTRLVRWGKNGLAFRTSNSGYGSSDSRLYILQSQLVSEFAPLPVGVQLASATPSAYESPQALSVVVTRTGDVTVPVTVDYATADGTAEAGKDYTKTGGTLSFAAGETSKTINIPIIDDYIYEGTENFTLTLSNLVGTNAVLVYPQTATVNIYDNDYQPSLNVGNFSIAEPHASATATVDYVVRLSNPTTRTVTLNYATSNGTAAAGSDYVSTSGTLTLEPLETNKAIKLQVLGDTVLNEPNENFYLNFSNVTNASAYYSQIVVTIVNNPTATRQVPSDFDGDGKTDISVYRPSGATGGEWWGIRSSDRSVFSATFGAAGDIPAPADYTGDGKTDIAFYRPSTGTWYILRSEDSLYYGFPFGNSTDVPAPADYDGDGKADAAVFRSGAWYILRSSDGGVTSAQFGIEGDKPVPADFDGDGKADIAIYRPNGTTGGEWWVLKSSGGVYSAAFGSATDKVAVGDWTGDGKADCAFFRPFDRTWYILRSEDQLFYGFPYGYSTDIPSPGDYDGDGKMDAATFRSDIASWYINQSRNGNLYYTFGSNGDQPVPGILNR